MTIRAVLCDLDGTLYRQGPLRAAMGCELALAALNPMRGAGASNTFPVLREFRRVREALRDHGRTDVPLEELQYNETAARTGVAIGDVRRIVSDWISVRPLKYLHRVRRRRLIASLVDLHKTGVPVGVFSDYPTREKLAALGVSPVISVEVCATDQDVNAFKPHPRGFLAACERFGLPPASVLYVGDRPEVDGTGAAAAGMHCAIVGARAGAGYSVLRSGAELSAVIERLNTAVGEPPPLGAQGAF